MHTVLQIPAALFVLAALLAVVIEVVAPSNPTVARVAKIGGLAAALVGIAFLVAYAVRLAS